MEKRGRVCITANRSSGGMYVGVTANLTTRAHQRRERSGSAHVSETGKTRQDYAERHEEIETAIAREKLVKKWRREWMFAADHHTVVYGGDPAFDLTGGGRGNPPLFDHLVSFLYANRVGRSAASPRRRRLSSS